MIWEIFIYTVNVVHMLNIHSNNFHGSVKAACILKMSLVYLAKGTHMYITIYIIHIMEMTITLSCMPPLYSQHYTVNMKH